MTNGNWRVARDVLSMISTGGTVSTGAHLAQDRANALPKSTRLRVMPCPFFARSNLQMAPRVNYIYIDYENVKEKDLSRIEGRSAVVHLVLGARQPDPAPELHHQIQRLAEKAELIRTPIAAKNSLDFVLACEVGMQAARDPGGYFHIVSNDKGFDVLIKHLRKKKILASRCSALREVPALMTTEERFFRLMDDLKDPSTPKPRTRTTLASKIQCVFGRTLSDQVVERTINLFIVKGIVQISESGRATYKL